MEINRRDSSYSVECKEQKKCYGILHKDDKFGNFSYLRNEPLEDFPKQPGNRLKWEDSFHIRDVLELDYNGSEYKNMQELRKYIAKCAVCKKTILRVKTLLQHLSNLRKSDDDIFCVQCVQLGKQDQCKRCTYFARNSKNKRKQKYCDQKTEIKSWLFEAQILLQAIIDEENTRSHKYNEMKNSSAELKNLLEQLKTARFIRDIDINVFPPLYNEKDSETEKNNILENIVDKLNQRDGGELITPPPSVNSSYHIENFKARYSPSNQVNSVPQISVRVIKSQLNINDAKEQVKNVQENKLKKGKTCEAQHVPSKGNVDLKISKTSTKQKKISDVNLQHKYNKEQGSLIFKRKYMKENSITQSKINKTPKVSTPSKVNVSFSKPLIGSQKDTTNAKAKNMDKKLINKANYKSENEILIKLGNIDESAFSKKKSDNKSGTANETYKQFVLKTMNDKKEVKRKVATLGYNDVDNTVDSNKNLETQIVKTSKVQKTSQKENITITGSDKVTKKFRTESKKITVLDSRRNRSRESPTPFSIDFRKQNDAFKDTLLMPDMNQDELLIHKLVKEKLKNKKEKKAINKNIITLDFKSNSHVSTQVQSDNEILDNASSDSYVFCDNAFDKVNEMISYNEIVPYDPKYKIKQNCELKPINYKVVTQLNCSPTKQSISSNTVKRIIKSNTKETGALKYALSDKKFIANGITNLPVKRVMKKLNVYRMLPAHPQFDWFQKNKDKNVIFYSTGELFAEFDEKGCGKWFYRNGDIALDHYCSTEINAQQRYVIYSAKKLDKVRKCNQNVTVLAVFDFLGNGIVYDHEGRERLKYNQTEGEVFDRSIGPPGKWKWHGLNDPPVLHCVYSEELDQDPRIAKLMKQNKTDDSTREDDDIVNIEFNNFVKERTCKLKQKFKPFQIRMKALRVNDYFSLRVINQSNIYLLFRDGTTCVKLNLGMVLHSTDIIDTDNAEVSNISTAYDLVPPKTESVERIQECICKSKQFAHI